MIEQAAENSPITLLLIEDHPGDARLIREHLADSRPTARPFAVHWVTTLAAGMEQLSTRAIDVILLDLSLPDSQGLETFIGTHRQAPEIPLIVLTGLADETLALEAVRQGAQDYLDKNELTPALLIRTIRYAIERRRSDLALRDREKRFRALLENIADTILILDTQGTLQYSSPSLETLLGCPPESLPPENFLPSIVIPEDHPRLQQTFKTLRQAHSLQQVVELRAQQPDGSQHTLEGIFQNRLNDPTVNGFIVTLRDITLRKRTEEALARSRDFYLLLLDNFPNPIWRSGPDAKYNYFNLAWLEFTGSTLDQQRGDGWLEGVHSADQKHCLEAYLEAFHTRQPFNIEHRMRRYDGQYRWMNNFGYPFYDLDGEFSGYLGSLYDLTERKQAEAQLRASEERFRTLVASIGDIVFTLDRRMRYTGIYGNFEKQFLVSSDELLEKTALELFGPAGAKPHMEAYEKTLAGESVIYEWFTPSPQGVRHYQTSLSPLRDFQGHVEGIVGVARDITELKQTLEALARERDLVARIMETSPIGILLLDPGGRITFTNAWADTILHLSQEMEPAHPTAPSPVQEAVRQILETGNALHNQRAMIETPAGPAHLTFSAAPLFDVARRIEAIIVMLEDVTEQIRAEQALRDSEETLRLLINGVPDALFVTDGDGTILVANETVANRLNTPYESLPGLKIDALLPPQVAESRHQLTEISLRTGKTVRFTDIRDGRYIENYINPLRDAAGRIIRYVVFAQDLTQRHQAELILRERETRLRALTENVPSFILELDAQGILTFINRSFPGYSREMLLNHPIDTWLSPQHQERLRAALDRVFADGGTQELELPIHAHDQEVHWYAIRIAPLYEADRVIRAIVLATDVTHHRKVEEALAREAAANAAIASLGATLLSPATLEELSSRILERACRLTDSRFGSLGYQDPATGKRVDFILNCDAPEASTTVPPLWKDSLTRIWQALFEQARPLFSNHPALELPALPFTAEDPPITRLLSAPTRLDNLPIGQLLLANAPRDYTSQDLVLAERLALLCALILQRHWAETALQENEKKFRSLVEKSPDGITMTDEAGMIVEWNGAMETITGRSRDYMLGRPAWEIQAEILAHPNAAPEAITQLKAELHEFYRTNQNNGFNKAWEIEFTHPSGEIHVLQTTAFKIETERGIAFGSINRDITELRATEIKKIETIQRQNTFQAALITLSSYPPLFNGELIPALQKLTETAAQALKVERVMIWQFAADRMHLQSLDLYLNSEPHHQEASPFPVAPTANFPPSIETGQVLALSPDHPLFCELQAAGMIPDTVNATLEAPIHRTGRVVGGISFQHQGPPRTWHLEERNFVGSLARMVAQALEAAERAQIQEALRNSERRLADTINFLPDATLVIDCESRIIAWNRAMEELTGVKAGDIIGRGSADYARAFYGYARPLLIDMVFHPDPELEKLYPFIHRENQTLATEIHTQHLKPGGLFLWERAAPLYNSQGQIVGAIESIRDITARKLEEQARAETAAELQQTNRQLERYAQDLVEANHLKELFADILRHDLLNPLAVIDGFADLLMERPSFREEQQAATSIKASVARLVEMIDHATLYARLESTATLPLEPQDLAAVIARIAQEFQPLLERKTMRLDYPPVPPAPVLVHPLIEHVFSNLISNAIKYSPDGQRLEIGIEDTPRYCRISVKDWGYGIPDKDKPYIFDRFTRADRRGVKGSGLGLAIGKRIVELHRGRIWIEDNLEGGTIFRVELPKPQPE